MEWILTAGLIFLALVAAGMALTLAEEAVTALKGINGRVNGIIDAGADLERRMDLQEAWKVAVQKQVEKEMNTKCEAEFEKRIINNVENRH